MTRADDSPVADFANMLRLDGRTYVVIGAGQGMGRQAAHALVQNGARIVCVDVDEDRANDIATEVGNDAVPWVGDVTKRDGVKRLFDDAGKVFGGKLNGFVDIVGMAQYSDLTEITDELWDWHIRHEPASRLVGDAIRRAAAQGQRRRDDDVRRVGVGHQRGAAACGIRRGQGRADGAGQERGGRARPRQHPRQRRRAGRRVDSAGQRGPRRRGQGAELTNAPLRRVAQTSNIASALLFFTSDLAAYVNGQTLIVDGGVGVKFPYPMDGL